MAMTHEQRVPIPTYLRDLWGSAYLLSCLSMFLSLTLGQGNGQGSAHERCSEAKVAAARDLIWPRIWPVLEAFNTQLEH